MEFELSAPQLDELSQEACDSYWMTYAMSLADKAEQVDEVPVGAVLVLENEVVGEGYNLVINEHDPCAHAEILALRSGGKHIENYRLLNAVLYVTLEPCCMCAGAIVHSRIKRVVFGASDLKTGAAGSAFSILQDSKHNHQVEVTGGVLASDCANQISAFFKKRRAQKKVLKQKK